MFRTTTGLGVLVLVLSGGAAACGGRGGYGSAAAPSTPPTAPSVAPAPAGVVAVRLVDDRFEPAALAARAGTPLTVRLANAGTAAHTFTIDGLGVDRTLAPGESATLTFTPASTGAQTFYCRFHRALGMTGTLSVTAPAAGAGGAAPKQAPPTASPTTASSSNSYGY